MPRLALAALALAAPLAAVPALPAFGDHIHYEGGCGFDTNAPPGSDTYSGVIYAAVVVVSPFPADAEVRCEILVDGATVVDVRFADPPGNTVVGAEPTSFQARDDQVVYLCETVSTRGGVGDRNCGGGPHRPFPPRVFWDLVDGLACPWLYWQPGTYGPLVLTEEGDAYLDGELWWDCPPYQF